jgi:hypothetical protein
MKILSLLMLSALLALMPELTHAADTAQAKDKPPVFQTLVREGDYAVRVAETLKLGKMGEVQAESKLASLGIAPLSGWISDFPVTPDIVAEVKSAVHNSAKDGKLSIDSKKAGEALDKLDASMGLPVRAAGEKPPEGYKSWQESSRYGNEYPPTVIDNYYSAEGPPVVTYYSPPYDYGYLYAWDPFPFWWGGVWFPGYYILTDFDCVVEVGGGGTAFVRGGHSHHGQFETRTLSNHIVDPRTKAVIAINPVTRTLPASIARTIPGARTTLADRTIQTRRMAALRTSVAPAGRRGGTAGTALHKGGIASGGARRFDAQRARSIFDRSVAARAARPAVNTGGARGFGFGGHQASPAMGGAHFNAAPSRQAGPPSSGGRSFSAAPSDGGRSFGGGGHSFGGGRSFGGGHSFGGGGGCRGRC